MVVILALAASASYLAFSQGSGGTLPVTTLPTTSSSQPATSSTSSTSSVSTFSTVSGTGSSKTTSSTVTTTFDQTSAASNASEVTVIIPPGIENVANKVSFEPISITIVIGVNNTIVFVNHDDQEHILESTAWPTDGQPFQFYSLPGSSNSVTFTTPGEYTYFCEWHPIWMDGSINVVA